MRVQTSVGRRGDAPAAPSRQCGVDSGGMNRRRAAGPAAT